MRKIASLFTILILPLTYGYSQTGIPRILINSLGHSAKIQSLNFTKDGNRIISVSEDKTARIWDAATGEVVNKFESQIGDGPEGMLYASAISPDGKILAMAGYTITQEKQIYIAIIDLQKGQQIATAVGHTNVVNSLAFTGNGKYLISGSDDGTIKAWAVTSSPVYAVSASINAGSPVKSLSVNPATMDVAVAAEGKSDVLVYSLAGLEKGATKFNPKAFKDHKGEVVRVCYAEDGVYLASSSSTNELNLWRADGSLVKEFETTNPINAIAFSHDSKIMAVLDLAGKGMSFGIPGGNKFTDFNGHDNTVLAAAFSPSESGSYVVASAGGNNNEIYLWNPINGRTIRKIKGKGSAIQDLAFGQGLELFISQDANAKPNEFKRSFDFNSIKLNPNTSKLAAPKKLSNGISQSSETILDLPKGKTIQNDPATDGRILDYQATADGNVVVGSDYSLKLYDRNGYFQKEFLGHAGGVRAVTVSADGRYLASGSEDQTIILWKLSETGAAPSLRQAFPEESWSNFFSSLPVDSLTKEPSKQAWRAVIDFLKANGDKTYKGIEEVYKNLGETVLPFATLFISEDNEWVCWTHKGYFSCTSSGSRYFGWHVNRGVDKLADFYAAEQYFEILFRPKQIEKSLSQARRVEDILKEEGERIFDLSKLHRPSAGFFVTRNLIEEKNNEVRYQDGRLVTELKAVTLDLEIFDGGGGVKEVNIYQNDKLIINDKEVKTTGEGQKVTKSYTIDLVNEVNEFKVVVINYQKIESRPEMLKIEYVGEVMATSSLHILAVGINKYQNAAYSLNYAQPDAAAFVEKLANQSQRIFKNINKVEIYDENATKENIVKGFKSIAAKAKPEDVFVFFYAGHGSLDEDNKDKDGDSPFYFVPTDITKLYGDPQQLQAKGLSGNELRNYLTHIKSTKQIVLMDACHSGGALKGMSVRAVASDEKAIVQLARSSGVVWIASSGSKQFATEFETLKHGVFTYALLEALDGKADNGDGKVTVNELKFFMEERVPELTKQYGGQSQYPTGYIHGNDFPISVIIK